MRKHQHHQQQQQECVAACARSVPGSSLPFNFSYSQRLSFPSMYQSLLELLLFAAAPVKGGVVVFFPSFAALHGFLAATAAAPLLKQLLQQGPLFAEMQTPGPTRTEGGKVPLLH